MCVLTLTDVAGRSSVSGLALADVRGDAATVKTWFRAHGDTPFAVVRLRVALAALLHWPMLR